MYILYGGDFTRAALVQWMLDKGGIAYELRKIDIVRGEHRSPWFLAINPAGLVPVLVTPEGEVLSEAAALLLYLAERHQLTALAPDPTDPQRGLFLSSLFFVATEFQAEMKRFHFPHRYSLRTEDNLPTQAKSKALIISRLEAVNTRLAARGPHLLGDRFSLADFYLCFWIAYLDHAGVCARWPHVAVLYETVRARPISGRYIAETEAAAATYAEMTRNKPAGVIA
jgi:glutathione S-transferase